MEKTFEIDWLPIFAGGLLVGGAILIPVSEGIRDANDVCGVTREIVACQPAIVPDADLPHRDHVPATSGNTTVTAVSTATSITVGTTLSTTVTGNQGNR